MQFIKTGNWFLCGIKCKKDSAEKPIINIIKMNATFSPLKNFLKIHTKRFTISIKFERMVYMNNFNKKK